MDTFAAHSLQFTGPDPRLPFEPAIALKNVQESSLKIAFISLDDVVLLANHAFQDAFGRRETLEGASILEIIASEHHDTYQREKKRLQEDLCSTVSMNLVCRSNPQALENLFVTLSIVRSPNGVPQYLRGIFRTEAEKRLVTARIKDDDLADSGHLFVAVVDKNGVFTRCEGELAWNLVPQIVGRKFTEVYEGIPEIQERVERAMRGEQFDVETYWAGLWYHVWYRPLLDSEGRPAGAIWTAQSIDREKQKELRLREAIEKQERATKIREEMLSMAAHEIRGPLSTLSMHIQLLEMKIASGETATEVLEHARDLVNSGRRQIEHVSKLVERTLDVSRMEERGLSLECRPCDLATLVREVIRKCSDRHREPRPMVSVVVPEKFTGFWDVLRMEQVVENLVSNAFKYGEGKPVTVMLESKNDRAILSVSDEGPGIPIEDQSKIFERFERGHARKNVGGFGMGLYIVRQIVQAHGGSVSVVSAPNKGTTFSVEIPIVFSTPSR